MKKVIAVFCMISTPAFADQIDTMFKDKCVSVMGNAKTCQCIINATVPNMPNPAERTVHYMAALRIDNWNQMKALPDQNGYGTRSRQASSALFAKPCEQ